MPAEIPTTGPTGSLKVVETRLKHRLGIAVYLETIMEDEIGHRWSTRASALEFDLKREDESNG